MHFKQFFVFYKYLNKELKLTFSTFIRPWMGSFKIAQENGEKKSIQNNTDEKFLN